MRRLLACLLVWLIAAPALQATVTVGAQPKPEPFMLAAGVSPRETPYEDFRAGTKHIEAKFMQDTSMLATARKVDWSTAGATYPTRSTVYTTLSPGASVASVNSALASCPSGQVVMLGAGTFTWNSEISTTTSNCTLRGAGPDQTFLVFTDGAGCHGFRAVVCAVSPSPVGIDFGTKTVANWTGGLSKGSTALTIACAGSNCATAGLQAGSELFLDQVNDSSDTGSVFICATGPPTASPCSTEGGLNFGRNGDRNESQTVKVVSVSGTTVNVTPAVAMPNYISGKSPQAWWSASLPLTGWWIENLTIDPSARDNGGNERAALIFSNADNSGAKNVRIRKNYRAQILIAYSHHISILDSYISESKTFGSQAYGAETFYASDFLIQNNIFQGLTAPVMSGSAQGCVVGYNYARDDVYNPYGATYPPGHQQMQAAFYNHSAGVDHCLYEGNIGNGFKCDDVHGTANFQVAFRNRWDGHEMAGKNQHTLAVMLYRGCRFYALVGNVLGDDGYHTSYQTPDADAGHAIYGLGLGADSLVSSTSMRWGNYDTYNDAARFVSGEVPSGLSDYPNSVPGSTTLPNSFYLPSKPGWFTLVTGGSVQWPPIGPDVTGGTISGVAGHAHKIPAMRCYELQPNDGGNPAFMTSFNADECYGSGGGGGDTTAPVVVISAPNGGSAYTTGITPLTTLAWTATDDSGVVSSCTCASSTGASCTATGTTSGTASAIALTAGVQTLTVTCVDAASNPGTDPIDVTYTPPAPDPAPLIYRIRIKGEQ